MLWLDRSQVTGWVSTRFLFCTPFPPPRPRVVRFQLCTSSITRLIPKGFVPPTRQLWTYNAPSCFSAKISNHSMLPACSFCQPSVWGFDGLYLPARQINSQHRRQNTRSRHLWKTEFWKSPRRPVLHSGKAGTGPLYSPTRNFQYLSLDLTFQRDG